MPRSHEAPRPAPIVLIVDDDDHVRDGLRVVLETEGLDVATADDGRAALDLLAQGIAPSLILLDLEMPRLDGEALCRALAADASAARIPVIVVSGRADTGAVLPGYVIARMGKPIDLGQLLDAVARGLASEATCVALAHGHGDRGRAPR